MIRIISTALLSLIMLVSISTEIYAAPCLDPVGMDTTSIKAYTGTSRKSCSSSSSSSYSNMKSLESISKLKGLKADCEENKEAVFMDGQNVDCPYDVTWDYGELYEKYIDLCDWSLIFDVDYYKTEFPCLALQYQNDDEWLLRHFQTVGIHEGRQGCKDFNVSAYFYNCDESIYKAFGHDFACYCIYYMLNYKQESKTDTVKSKQGTNKICKQILTNLQNEELEYVNNARKVKNEEELIANAELTALANYRAYINNIADADAHDWVEKNSKNEAFIKKYCENIADENNLTLKRINENTVQTGSSYAEKRDITGVGQNYGSNYSCSKPHWDALMKSDNNYIGISHTYFDFETDHKSQFQIIMNMR